MSLSIILSHIGVALFVAFFFSFCIFIHELGHFLAAKWRGMHIIAFSIGFKKAWGYKYKGVDYRIGWLPFGGYVDLPQIDATGQPKDENGNPLPPGKPLDRIITAVAGPLFNILFGFVLATFVWWHGIPQSSPSMSEVVVNEINHAGPEYKAGLREGDRIVGINGIPVAGSWNEIIQNLVLTTFGKVRFDVRRGGEKLEVAFEPKPNPAMPEMEKEGFYYPFFSPSIPVLARVKNGSEAEKVGFRSGDMVVSVDGTKVFDPGEFNEIVDDSQGKAMNIIVSRGGRELVLSGVKAGHLENLDMYIDGLIFEEPIKAVAVQSVITGEPGEKAGIKEGDMVVGVNGKSVEYLNDFIASINSSGGKPMSMVILRGGEPYKIEGLAAKAVEIIDNDGAKKEKFRLGIALAGIPDDASSPLDVTEIIKDSAAERAGFKLNDKLLSVNGEMIDGFAEYKAMVNKGRPMKTTVLRDKEKVELELVPAIREFYAFDGLNLQVYSHPTPWRQLCNVVTMTARTLKGWFSPQSKIGFRHLSGPVGIFVVIGKAAYHGSLTQALYIIVIITFSLGLLNLMPIPVLDGGHIVMALIEMVFRRPLPAKLVQPVVTLCAVILISFMLLVTLNDTWRRTPLGGLFERNGHQEIGDVDDLIAKAKPLPSTDGGK